VGWRSHSAIASGSLDDSRPRRPKYSPQPPPRAARGVLDVPAAREEHDAGLGGLGGAAQHGHPGAKPLRRAGLLVRPRQVRPQQVQHGPVPLREVQAIPAQREADRVRARAAQADQHLVLDPDRAVVGLVHLGGMQLALGEEVGELVRAAVAGREEPLEHRVLAVLPRVEPRPAVVGLDDGADGPEPRVGLVVGRPLAADHAGERVDGVGGVGVEIGLRVRLLEQGDDRAQILLSQPVHPSGNPAMVRKLTH
jgi:hypothetical protein